ncbi:MAG: winged helix DNA-binding protein [Oscillospiraceae bacterium]|nr:winged helix DNA-binding protein [Oscillospiraceae bacterium]
MDKKVPNQILQFNQMYKEYNDIYQNAARNFDMPTVSFWLIYVLRQKTVCTQKDFMDQLYYPKQTINSALKLLEKREYVTLKRSEEDRRSKLIYLTEKGQAFAKDTADKIICAENAAFSSFTDSERETFFSLFERLSTALQKEMQEVE